MKINEIIVESSRTAGAEQVWDYVRKIHPEDQQGGGFLKRLIMRHPQYELKRIPLSSLHIPDQELDDEEQQEPYDPYGRAMFVDPEHAGEYSMHHIDTRPIVIDTRGNILDGSHRAWAAAELMNKKDIMAYVPVLQLDELGNAPTEYKANRKRSRSLFHATVDGQWVDVFFDRSEFNGTLHITFTVNGNYDAPEQPTSASKSTVKILSTVLNIVKKQLPEYMAKARPPAISFTSKQDNRTSLYRKYFVPVIQNILGPKWQHEEYPSMGMTVFHWRPVKKQGVTEAFDQPYTIQWTKTNGDWHATADLDDGSELIVLFMSQGDNQWMVEFERDENMEITGEGDAPRVFATVLTAMRQFIAKRKPAMLNFSAEKEDDPTGSRARLYDRMLQRYITGTGYDLTREDMPGGATYTLTRTQQGVAESREDFEGITIEMKKRGHVLDVSALDDWGNNILGYVIFNIGDNNELDPQELEVDHRYQGQGIAKAIYDYTKSKGYTINRSWDQTDAGKGFWDKHRGEDVRVWEQGVAEVVNKEIWHPERIFNQRVPIGDYEFEARESIGGMGDYDADALTIIAYDPKKKNKIIGNADFVVKGRGSKRSLVSDDTYVDPKYRGEGIATMMYAYAKSLGNDIKGSNIQTPMGKKMWANWGNDAKHLRGVAEEQLDELFQHGKQNWTWKYKADTEAIAKFTVGDRDYVWQAFSHFRDDKPHKWEIQFRVVKQSTDPEKLPVYGTTGTGNSAEVMSNAVDIMREFLQYYGDGVQQIAFDAKENSRIALYRKMIQRLLPNWNADEDYSSEYGLRFTLTRPKSTAQGLSEARNSLFAFVKQQFPTWPDYVLKDFLYQQAKGIRDQAELDDFLKRNKQDFGNCKWTLTKLPITFDIFTPKTQRMLASREGGSSNPFQVPRDAERHALQSQMIQQKGVSAEPIIVAKLSNGYDLIEGWHRTIQHLKAFPQGYTGPAWVCTGATYKSESVDQGVAQGLTSKQPGKPVVDAIQKVMPIAQEIWFHGSRATGKHRRNSDTDILVVVPDDFVGDQYLAVVRTLQKLSSIFDNYDIQPTKSGTNIHRMAQEEGRLLWSSKQGMAESENNDTAISLSKLGKFHPGADSLAEFVPERATAQYALHPDKWESTFYSLTNKDSEKLKYYGPKKISIPPGTLVGDMAIANKFYRAKTPEEKQQYAELYKASLQPYPVDVSEYRMPELLIPKQGVAEGSEEINWIKPNFDYEWDEIEFQAKQPQVPADVRNYMAKHFPNKQAWMKSVQHGRPVVVSPDHGQKIRNYTDNKKDLLNALSPQSHDPQGPAKAKRVNALFDKGGPIEMPIILQTEKGLWLIGGKTRLGTANLLKGIPAKVWMIGGEQDMAENFADGKNPGRKGLAKRSGVNTKASVSSLRKTAKNSSGEKQRMAHWLANMKAGKAKKNG